MVRWPAAGPGGLRNTLTPHRRTGSPSPCLRGEGPELRGAQMGSNARGITCAERPCRGWPRLLVNRGGARVPLLARPAVFLLPYVRPSLHADSRPVAIAIPETFSLTPHSWTSQQCHQTPGTDLGACPPIERTDSGQTEASWRPNHNTKLSLSISGKRQTSPDVLFTQIGKVRDDLRRGDPRRKILKHILHRHPQSANARLSRAFPRLERDNLRVIHQASSE
jgi:hypothetical protein